MTRGGGFGDGLIIEQNDNFVQFRGGATGPLPKIRPDAPACPVRLRPLDLRRLRTVMIDYRTQAPEILRDFLAYHETVKAHSKRTVDEYFLDLRNFFRYLKQTRDPSLCDRSLDEIDIMDVDLDFVASVTPFCSISVAAVCRSLWELYSAGSMPA